MKQASDIEQRQQQKVVQNLLIMDHRFGDQIAKFLKETYTTQELPNLVSKIRHKDPIMRHRAAIGIRRLLSKSSGLTDQIQQIIDAGAVPSLIFLMKQTKYPHLRLEAAWALANIVNGNSAQCQIVINNGGIPAFVKLLKANNLKLIQEAIWGIANIAATSDNYRDILIQHKVIDKIIKKIKKITNQRLMKLCCWAISSLCRGNPLPRGEQVKSGILFLCGVIAKCRVKDSQAIKDCCWAISYHTKIAFKDNEDLFQLLVKNLVRLSSKDKLQYAFIIPVVRIFANASNSTDQITNILVQQNVLTLLNNLLKYYKEDIRRQVCLVISNVAAGSKKQTNAVIRENGLMKKLVELLDNDGVDVKRQVCYIFKNLACREDQQAVCSIYVDNNIIGLCYRLLAQNDKQATQIALQTIEYIVTFASMVSNRTCSLVLGQLRREGAPQGFQKLECSQSDYVIDFVKRLLIGLSEEKNDDY